MSENAPEVTPIAPVSTVVSDAETDAIGVERLVKDDAPEVEADVATDEKSWSLAKGIVMGLGHQAEEAERILVQLWNSGLKVVKHDAPAKSASDVFPTAVPPVS